jgi:hypothetical protein
MKSEIEIFDDDKRRRSIRMVKRDSESLNGAEILCI